VINIPMTGCAPPGWLPSKRAHAFVSPCAALASGAAAGFSVVFVVPPIGSRYNGASNAL
jgi:hypothetical protein